MERVQDAELLDETAFSLQDAARACGMEVHWIEERVQAGVLHVHLASGEWRFDSATVVRARRVAQLEQRFDADPQLAALTADLIEEVARLRRLLGVR